MSTWKSLVAILILTMLCKTPKNDLFKATRHALRQERHNRGRIMPLPSTNVTIIDNGSDCGFCGRGWTPTHQYKDKILYDGEWLPQVDAIATVMSMFPKKRLMVIVARRMAYQPER